MMKECCKCKEVKPYSEFHKNKRIKDGFRSSCKYCRKKYYEENKEKISQRHKQYYQENKDKIKQHNKQYYKKYYEENKDKISQRQKQYDKENKEKKKQYRKENKERIKQWREENKEKLNQYYKENKDKISQRQKQYKQENKERIKQYREENKEKLKQYHQEYKKQKRKTDPIFRLRCNIAGLIHKSLKRKGYSKKTRTYKILGLEHEDFYTWLNTEASNGLNFDIDDVHVDHVIPVSFGKTEEQVLALNHYSNLQLLTSEENLNKKNTYIKQSNLDRVMTHHPDYSMLTKILLNYDYLMF